MQKMNKWPDSKGQHVKDEEEEEKGKVETTDCFTE